MLYCHIIWLHERSVACFSDHKLLLLTNQPSSSSSEYKEATYATKQLKVAFVAFGHVTASACTTHDLSS